MAEQEIREATAQLRDFESGRALYDFIASRLASSDYSKRLGVVTQIRKDFKQLEIELSKNKWLTEHGTLGSVREETQALKSRPLTRVVLYIDDLDRCPPDRVVKVLEAIHLLLAQKLFVVVVAADPKWLLNCLAFHYKELLILPGSGEQQDDAGAAEYKLRPSQYLEKIFQIPFQVGRMREDGYKDMLDTLVDVEAKREGTEPDAPQTAGKSPARGDHRETANAATPVPTGATESESKPFTNPSKDRRWDGSNAAALRLSADELKQMKELHPLLGTPRNVKSFVNTYLLHRVLQHDRLKDYLGGEEFQVLLVRLAAQVGDRELFGAIEAGIGKVENEPQFRKLLRDAIADPSDPEASATLDRLAAIPLPRSSNPSFYADKVAEVARYSFGLATTPDDDAGEGGQTKPPYMPSPKGPGPADRVGCAGRVTVRRVDMPPGTWRPTGATMEVGELDACV